MQPYPPNQPQNPYAPGQSQPSYPQTPPPPPTGSYAPTAPGQGAWQTQTPPPYAPAPGQMPGGLGGPMPPRKKSRKKLWITLGIIFGVLIVIGAISNAANPSSGTGSSAQPTQAATSQQQTQNQPTQASTPAPTPTPKPSFATFGDGTFIVGKDIKAGTYRTRQGSPGCYWARLKGFGGSVGDILANDNIDDPAIVTISASDKGFESRGCGTWTSDLSQITSSKTTFTDGMYFVKTDITPGTYKSSGQTGCYWARLSGFHGGIGDILANDNTDNPAVVTITSSDKGFESKSCGTWKKI